MLRTTPPRPSCAAFYPRSHACNRIHPLIIERLSQKPPRQFPPAPSFHKQYSATGSIRETLTYLPFDRLKCQTHRPPGGPDNEHQARAIGSRSGDAPLSWSCKSLQSDIKLGFPRQRRSAALRNGPSWKPDHGFFFCWLRRGRSTAAECAGARDRRSQRR